MADSELTFWGSAVLQGSLSHSVIQGLCITLILWAEHLWPAHTLVRGSATQKHLLLLSTLWRHS